MKFSAVLLLVCSALAYVKCDEAHKELMEKVIAGCQKETQASDADVANMRSHEAAKTSEDKCLRACVFKKFELMDSNGNINLEKFIEVVKIKADGDKAKEDMMVEIIEACAPIEVSNDHCEASAQYSGCIVQTAKDKRLQLPEL